MHARMARLFAVFSMIIGLVAISPAVAAASFAVPCGDSAALASAIASANDEATHPGADTVSLEDGCVYTLTSVAEDDPELGPTGLPAITSTITITGTDSVIERSDADGTPLFRLLRVAKTGDLTLDGILLRGGAVGSEYGGAIYSEGTLLVSNSTLTSNSAQRGGAIRNDWGYLTVSNSLITRNYGDYAGGGISNRTGASPMDEGYVTIDKSTISSNWAKDGGGIVQETGLIEIFESEVADNDSDRGGGIASLRDELNQPYTPSTIRIINSTVLGNHAQWYGGGVLTFGDLTIDGSSFIGNYATEGNGGGIVCGEVTITNSTFDGNFTGDGPGGALSCGTATVDHSTFVDNRAHDHGGVIDIGETGAFYVSNSIMANNYSNQHEDNCYGNVVDLGGNISFGNETAADPFSPREEFSCPGANVDPLLGSYGDHGGPTATFSLLPGSPAIDAAVSCLPTDQRGVTRPQGPACDIGAYEWEYPAADRTAPVVTIDQPVDGAVYLLNEPVLASYSCADETGGSGLTTCDGTVPDGAALDTGTVGAKSFSVTATDNAGNSTTAEVTYTVAYAVSGFASPVHANGATAVKAGQSVPLKWRVTDANGAPITDLSAVSVTATTLECALGTTDDLPAEQAAGRSGLQNLGDGYYQFNWKTPKSYAKSCKTLSLDLGDGTIHTADFMFTK